MRHPALLDAALARRLGAQAGGHGDHGHAHGGHADHGHAHDDAGHSGHDEHAAVEPGIGGLAYPVAVLAMLVSFVLSLAAVVKLGSLGEHAVSFESPVWHWIDTGVFSIDISMVIDRLSSVMVLIITGVGLLIHVYSGGYMKGDPGYAKFFAYLNLFVFAMLMLVLSSSLLGLFVGWEGVGLCSYLLIGFWYEKGWPAEAGQKAFVMNRIGDASFLIGSFLLVHLFGTLDLSDIAGSLAEKLAANPGMQLELFFAGLCLFGGACGKSAQIPLFTWLPDAMAGPTPVSALIHAATMVTAGVYLVVRLNPLFAANPNLLFLIGTVGALTAFVAGTTALVQRDIKKVLAYSTVSQLGYMFLALGTGAFSSAIFHLATHAFFKALLFLGAGSVIHGMHHEQDMHKMGNLRKYMPQTFLTFLVGAAALSGLPLLSGFFSKDEILGHVYAQGGGYYVLWGIGILTAAMTAFYTWRMVALTFFGPERFDKKHFQPHESPLSMTLPLLLLAALAILGGALSFPPVFEHFVRVEYLRDWLAPVTDAGTRLLEEHAGAHELEHTTEWILLGLGALIALGFAHTAFHRFKSGIATDEATFQRSPLRARFLFEAWGIDKAYTLLVVQPVRVLALMIAAVVDGTLIDGFVNGAAQAALSSAARVRTMASGRIATYGLWMGAVTALIAILLVWNR
ncbi:MAG: NADH-quinone oxidoreductase subunit L [Planctomycetes bacterium]|nr:NADH-quinone oxidoreductase subunit L [Planctomycetota bacterium]